MNVLLLGGSPSSPSSSWRLLQLAGERLAALGHRTAALQVRELPPRALLGADLDDPAIAAAVARVREADAVLVATPVYQAAYSGLLKVFLDLLPRDGLAGKLVLPLATGGSQSHMLALDYALRPVLASLGPRHILASVYASAEQLAWEPAAGLRPAPPLAARIDAAIGQLALELQVLAERRFGATPRELPASAFAAA